MPRISEFYGIVIEMFHNDHGPPHFHARYAEHKATVGIDPVVFLLGRLPARAERMVVEWAFLRRRELSQNWSRARCRQPLAPIDPLD